MNLPLGIPDGARCVSCRGRPHAFRGVFALGEYRRGEALREWILSLKHGGRRDLARPLARALGASIRGSRVGAEFLATKPVFVPVPLHRSRRVERGYDQSDLLSCELAEALGARSLVGLRRLRATPPQGDPGVPSRRANVEGAFGLAPPARSVIPGRSVALVDDVVTSAATAHSCAQVLRRAGAGPVVVVALARAAR